jgi:hypothetical protein
VKLLLLSVKPLCSMSSLSCWLSSRSYSLPNIYCSLSSHSFSL